MNGYKVVVDKSTVPVGTAEGPRRHPPRDDASVQRRQQSGVPEAGRGHRRLHEAGPRRHRRRRRARRRADEGAVRAVHAHWRADHDDGLRQRRAVQVRRERDAGDAHLVHERSRQRLRSWSAPTSTRSATPSARTAASAPSFLFPGVGYGGSCFPKDVKAMMRFAEDKDYDFKILRAVETVNERQKRRLVDEDGESLQVASRASASRSGGWRSSRRPTTCARRRQCR